MIIMDKDRGIYDVKGGFNVLSEFYDSDELRFFLDSSKQMVQELECTNVKNILDLATGTGHTVFELSEKASNAHITGIDISETMLSKAELKKGQRKNIVFKHHDIEALQELEGKYDLITCSFGTYFIQDLERFFKSVFDKLEPNGKFVLTSFAEESFMPFSKELFIHLKEMGIIQKEPQDFSALNEKYLRGIGTSGFKNVKTIEKKMQYKIKSPEEWWKVIWGTGFRSFLSDLNEHDLRQFKDYHLNKVDQMIYKGLDTYRFNILILIGEINLC